MYDLAGASAKELIFAEDESDDRRNDNRATDQQDALERLTAAIRDVESKLAAMKAEHDPLASHIFVSLPPVSER
jgi:hypothetical protein